MQIFWLLINNQESAGFTKTRSQCLYRPGLSVSTDVNESDFTFIILGDHNLGLLKQQETKKITRLLCTTSSHVDSSDYWWGTPQVSLSPVKIDLTFFIKKEIVNLIFFKWTCLIKLAEHDITSTRELTLRSTLHNISKAKVIKSGPVLVNLDFFFFARVKELWGNNYYLLL